LISLEKPRIFLESQEKNVRKFIDLILFLFYPTN